MIPGYSNIVRPLCDLTKKDCLFNWGESQEEAFHLLKAKLLSTDVVSYFDPNKDTCVHVDASPTGLGAMLTQEGKVIAYASKMLSPTECRYSQIEQEALAISWACHHFRMYLLGKQFSVVTDHKPLLAIFNNTNSKASARIENWRLRLQRFDFKVHFRQGSDNPADFISRYVLHKDCGNCHISESCEDVICCMVQGNVPKALSMLEIKEATCQDSVLQAVIKSLGSGN